MLGKTSKPMMKILMGSITNHHQIESSKNHQSPNKGLRGFDLGGVGLGIVAALEKSRPANKALFSRNMSRSKPVPVNSTTTGCCEEMDSLEEYTIVTCQGPKESYTKVYGSTTSGPESFRKLHDHKRLLQSSTTISNNKIASSVFHISPAKSSDFSRIPTSDFLSSCDMCKKKLHGKDVYMYRGEKGFCSTECRYNQIVIDERKEKYCSKGASRQVVVAVDVVSSSPCASAAANGQMFTTGILAT